ncbi:MAG: hypothetical protein QF886_14525 [Planctomycetota bacterium]|nr:hypothetical protein [Planctomycetota bacterium]
MPFFVMGKPWSRSNAVQPAEPKLNARQQWALDRLRARFKLQLRHTVEPFGCPKHQARSVIESLSYLGYDTDFTGSKRSGHYFLE